MGTSSPADALQERLDHALPLLRELVRCPTTGAGAATEEALQVLVDHLAQEGLSPRVVRSAGGVPTMLVTVAASAPGPHVLLQGHLDVVPVDDGWDRDPFAADVVDGVVHGRGTVDMKAGLVAFALVLASLHASRGLSRGAVTLLVDVDEETGSEHGLNPYIAEHGLEEFDWAICGEPTDLRPYLGNRGLVWATVSVRGAAAHAGMPQAGLNPIPVLAALIGRLPAPPLVAGPHGSSGPSLTPTVVRAGQAVNSVPDTAEVRLDRRVVPSEDLDSVVAQLLTLPQEVPMPPGVRGQTTIDKVWPPCLLDERSVLARVAQEVTTAAGRDGSFGFDDASNDASFLSAAGLPVLVWGPGDPELAHTSREHVRLADVHAAAGLYLEAVLRLTSEGPARDR